MSSESLVENRTNAINVGSAPAANEAHYVEIDRSQKPNITYWYRFKDDTLGAVSKSVRIIGHSKDQIFLEAGETLRKYSQDFSLVGVKQIVRSFNAESVVLSAQHWQQNSQTQEIYIIVSNHEITQVLFDPKKFGFSDFFLSAERLPDVQANEKVVREMMKDVQNTKSQSNLAPLIDLLPEVAKESVSTPMSTVITQAAPMPPAATPVQQLKSAASPTPAPEPKPASPGFPVVPVAIVVAVVVGIVLYLLRRKSM